jgi:hypothetical protein
LKKDNIKSVFVILTTLAISACNSTVPNNSIPVNKENFRDLDREYVFSTKELTESYLKRKIEKWLDTANEGANPNGPKLVKEIAYASFKYRNTFCTIIQDDPPLIGLINAVQEVQDRSDIDVPFRNFLDSCDSTPALTGEFQVNTYTDNYQYSPMAAMDADGDFVITWQSGYFHHGPYQDGSYFGIYAQRYSATALPAGAEFRVNAYTTDHQRNQSIAMNAAGNFVIAWQSLGQDGDAFGTFARRYNQAGSPVGSEFLVNIFTTNSQHVPSVAMDAAGDFVITWSSEGQDDDSTFQGNVFARRYSSTGSPISSEFRVNTYTTDTQYASRIAMDAAGDFVITWLSREQDGNNLGVYAQRYGSTGSPIGTEFRVNTYTDSKQDSPAIAMDSNGDFVITWMSYIEDGSSYGIYAQRYSSTGSPVGTEFRVNTYTSRYQTFPTIAMDSDGDFVVAWSSGDVYAGEGQEGDYYGIYAQRYGSTGSPVGTEFHVNTYTSSWQFYPSAAMDSDGDFVITWGSYLQLGNGYEVYAQRYNSSGVAQ